MIHSDKMWGQQIGIKYTPRVTLRDVGLGVGSCLAVFEFFFFTSLPHHKQASKLKTLFDGWALYLVGFRVQLVTGKLSILGLWLPETVS